MSLVYVMSVGGLDKYNHIYLLDICWKIKRDLRKNPYMHIIRDETYVLYYGVVANRGLRSEESWRVNIQQ